MRRYRTFLPWILAALAVAGSLRAETFSESFDEGPTTWRVEHDPKSIRTFDHRRQRHLRREGNGAEHFKAEVARTGGEVSFVHSLSPAVAIEDLRLSIWIRSNQTGLQLRMRVVLPDESDPETGGPVTFLVSGDRYTTPGEWQELTCSVPAATLQDGVRRARYRLNRPELSDRGLYVDQAVLSGTLSPQPVEVLFDDLTFAPVVAPVRPNELLTASLDVPEPDGPVEFRLNRLMVEGEPFFPIIAAYHDEPIDDFAATGVNVAWIFDYRSDGLLDSLRAAGLWATAIPPRPEENGRILDPQEAGMLPYGSETRAILFWNLGPHIPAHLLDQLIGWKNQLHAADIAYDRPILADVTGAEYAFSNHVDLLGVSRHITNTGISFHNWRDWLQSRRGAAFLNTFFLTWVQTEPAKETVAVRSAAGHLPVVIEPEQIRLQVYSALQAGCRGLGYWKRTRFDADGPGTEERRLVLAQLNMELKLLGPLLATSEKPRSPISFVLAPSKPGSDGHRSRAGYDPVTLTGRQAAATPFAPKDKTVERGDAVLLKTDFGLLLLAVCHGEGAQFCPGPMAANNVKIVVPGVEETASAWLLTTTGVQHLSDRRVPGGKEITLRKFDQTAAVLFTSDPSQLDRFRLAGMQTADKSARVSVELARSKRQRVADVDRRIRALSSDFATPDGARMLQSADRLIAQADTSLQRNDLAGAKEYADDAMQMLRHLQRAYWTDAVRELSSPLTSPHTISYSTLPDHYRLITLVGRNRLSPSDESNVLPTGDFEDFDRIWDSGWVNTPYSTNTVSAGSALDPADRKEGSYSLQLYAVPQAGESKPIGASDAFVTFRSPSIPVSAGQILHVSGWVKVDHPIPAHLDGATLHDSLLGPSSGLRWTKTNGWERFEMLREIPQDGPFDLTLTLHGEGEVHFDDLRIAPHTPRSQIAEQPPAPAASTGRITSRPPSTAEPVQR